MITAFRSNKPHCGPGNPTSSPSYTVFVSVGDGNTEAAVLTRGVTNEDGQHSQCTREDLLARASNGSQGLAVLPETMSPQWVRGMLEYIPTLNVPWDDIHKPDSTCRYIIHRQAGSDLPPEFALMITDFNSDEGDYLLTELIEQLGVCANLVETIEILHVRAGAARQDWHRDCVAGNVNYMIHLTDRETTRVRR